VPEPKQEGKGDVVDPGLCSGCVWVRVIVNRRDSRFYLCDRSRQDPRFPRYPRLPVLRCPGYVPR